MTTPASPPPPRGRIALAVLVVLLATGLLVRGYITPAQWGTTVNGAIQPLPQEPAR